ncbi:MAG: N-acetylneuraminate synthase [Coriobacteriia bacterium]|nr:N-acetylneuraminate synthase [Coriobacteriia bacterium]
MNSVFIIAEAGVNHEGSLDRALRMVDAAAAAGADAVKFQTFSASRLATRGAPKADYQTAGTPASESQYEMLSRLELDMDAHAALMKRCAERGIIFMSAAFDIESLNALTAMGIDRVKVPSGEVTNTPYLRAVARTGLPVLLSTGMATLDEVSASLAILEEAGLARDRVTVLHCTTEYPADPASVNLRAMVTMRNGLGVRVGYSDHTEGIDISLAAVALGAEVLEKHFTLDRTLPGPDHRASLEPSELTAMVAAVRRIELALGDGIKNPSALELENAAVARKSLVAERDIAEGEPFTAMNIAVKRPGSGMSPLLWDHVIGRTASRDYGRDDLIEEDL